MRLLTLFAMAMLSLAFINCDLNDTTGTDDIIDTTDVPPTEIQELTLMDVTTINIPEPSGLSIDIDNGFLYTVSDPKNNLVYKMSLDGTLLTTFPFVGDDLEGVAFDTRDNSIWVVEESLGQIVHLSDTGEEISHTQIDYSGFEGICFRDDNNGFNLLIEKDPSGIVHVDSNLVTQEKLDLTIAPDISGICPGRKEGEYLIVSHKAKRLYEWSWETGLIATYSTGVEQGEGVAYDPNTDIIYIVCDATSQLYRFKF